MNKPVTIFVFFLWAVFAAHSQSPEKAVSIGKIYHINSEILGEEREIWVHVPQEEGEGYAPPQYPVVYLLDGQGHFYTTVGLMHQLSTTNGNTLSPQMIIVGIANKNQDQRTRDLTPTAVTESIYVTPEMIKTSGGGERFTTFLEKELFPWVEQNFPTAPYRMLIGHSYGGLMVVNTLLHHPELFNSYLCLDPSLWWDNQKLVNQFANTIDTLSLQGKYFYLAMANTLQPGISFAAADTVDHPMLTHIKAIIRLKKILEAAPQTGLQWAWKFYPEENHQELPMLASYEGFRFFFREHKAPELVGMFSSPDPPTAIIEAHYARLSQVFGYPISPSERQIELIASVFGDLQQYDREKMLLEMNLKNYPKSIRSMELMGDYYSRRSQPELARKWYLLALDENEVPAIREKLNQLP